MTTQADAALTGAEQELCTAFSAGLPLDLRLHFIPDADGPHQIVARLMDAVPSGSFLLIVHVASDLDADTVAEATRLYNELSSTPVTMRSLGQVTKFFDGLEIIADVGSGAGQVNDAGGDRPSYSGIGRKP